MPTLKWNLWAAAIACFCLAGLLACSEESRGTGTNDTGSDPVSDADTDADTDTDSDTDSDILIQILIQIPMRRVARVTSRPR